MSSNTRARLQTDRITRVIFEYAARIAGAQDPDVLLELNAGLARDLVAADRCSIWLADTDRGELRTKVAHGMPEIRIPVGQGLVGACIETNETLLVNDTSTDPRFAGGVDKESGYVTHSVLVIPLHGSGGKVIGALQALNKPGGFSADDVDLLGLAAAYAASAIEAQRLRQETEASRLLYRELEIARSVQERLLPEHPPVVEGVEWAAFCRPAKFVGGDYYDFIAPPGDSLAFTQGDVCGKGIAAAMLMASLQSLLRSELARAPASLASLMNKFNDAVCRSVLPEGYSTLFCGQIDKQRKRLTYVNAGHVRPLLLRPSGALERLDVGGVPVGLFKVARYKEGLVDLAPGDVLVCYSDGIGEVTNAAGELWQEAEIEKVLRQSVRSTASDIVEGIVGAAADYAAGAEQADDMTLIVIRIL
jgi:sigma-B regulation protein RsbU (phosphoserine phosphatase)